jgi:16S rRNA (cytidine1402-2'-O)-methyltransferase
MSAPTGQAPPNGDASYTIDGQRVRAPAIEPGLYVVATPIGNLRDITLRALATLAAADLIACEDTRVTRVLTRHYGIDTELMAYHEHNADRQRPKLLAALAAGKTIALVSDAGTPLVSDPGFRLVGDMVASGHRVVPIPGLGGVAHGHLPVRRLPAQPHGRPQEAAGGARRHPGNAHFL